MWRVALFLPCLLLVSCATTVSGTSQNIVVDSEPAGANVVVTCADGRAREGVTPAKIAVERKADRCVVNVARQGFTSQTVVLEKQVNRAYWGNFGFTPLVLIGVAAFTGVLYSEPDAQSRTVGAASLATVAAAWLMDRRNGAIWSHEPRSIRVVLVPEAQSR